jgi:CRP-like cAMP-binding protein
VAADGKVEALRKVGLFAGCTTKELRSVAGLCMKFNVDEGFVLTTQGTPGRECFVIGAGDAEVMIDGQVVAKVGPGDCVGEMSLLDHGLRTATVTALTPMTVYSLSAAEFRSLLETNAVTTKIMTTLARRLRDAEGGRDLSTAQV